MRKTKKLALCAIFSGCSVVLLFAAAVFDVLDLSLVALSSLLVIITHIELGGGYDWLLKFVFCNVVFAGVMLLARFLLFPGTQDYRFTVPLALLVNAAFFCYDYATSCLIGLYVHRLRRQFRLDRLFR